MGDILITVGALLTFLVFILVAIGGVLFLGSLLGGLGNWLLGSAWRDEARQVKIAGEDVAGQILCQQLENWKFRALQHQARPIEDQDETERLVAEGKAHFCRLKRWYIQHGLDPSVIEQAEAAVMELEAGSPPR